MILCPNCGRENADNFNFCLDCGFDLKSYRASQTPTASATNAHDPSPAPAAAAPSGVPAPAPSGVPSPADMATPTATETMSQEELSSAAQAAVAALPPDDDDDMNAPPPMGSAPPGVVTPPQSRQPLIDVAQDTLPHQRPDSVTAMGRSGTAPAMAPGGTELGPSSGSAPCPSCSAPIPVGNKFCGNCGARTDGSAPPTPAAAPGPEAGRTMFMHAADLSQVSAQKTCKLVTIDQSGQEGMTYSLKSGETACGRINGVVLFYDDNFVSPSHCTFNFDGQALHVADGGSLNGIYTRVQVQVLSHGDFLRIGRQLLRYESMGELEAAVPAPTDDTQLWGSPLPPSFGRLVQVLEDGHAGEVRLLTGDICRLGREHGDIVYPTDGFISGRHCTFTPEGATAKVEDLGSSNGTYLRVRDDVTLGHGDFLLVGNQMLRIEIV